MWEKSMKKTNTRVGQRTSAPEAAPKKTIRNVSLQSWTISSGNESIFLTPGSAVEVPVAYINQRMRNLQKRRLIHIS